MDLWAGGSLPSPRAAAAWHLRRFAEEVVCELIVRTIEMHGSAARYGPLQFGSRLDPRLDERAAEWVPCVKHYLLPVINLGEPLSEDSDLTRIATYRRHDER
jgi:hypothetical protein